MTTRKHAVIDIGTNSLKLLVAKVTPKGLIEPISEQVVITRLGQGLDESGRISSTSVKRTLLVIKRFLRTARRAKVNSMVPPLVGCHHGVDALATSAVREAHNATSFIHLVRKETGLDVKVLSPQEESKLAYLGATFGACLRRGFGRQAGRRRQQNNSVNRLSRLVVDIGGGSTELSYTSSGKFYAKHFPLGAVKITERFIHSDPVSETDYQVMTAFILKHLRTIGKNIIRRKYNFIGVGGTIVTLAAIDLKLKRLIPHKIHGHKMSLTTLDSLLDCFKTATLKAKKKIGGLEPGRADIILAGTSILVNLMKLCRVRTIRTSTAGLRQGWLLVASSATHRRGGR